MSNKLTHFIFWFFIGVILIVITCAYFGWCSQTANPPVKNEVKQLTNKRDSVLTLTDTIYKEVVRYVTKYRHIRYDSLVPCEEKLLICDTIIIKDSSLIRELQTVIKLDSLIIDNQNNIIRADSLTKIDLTEAVKKEKRKKVLWQVIAGVTAIAGLTTR